MAKLLNIGFGNVVNMDKIVAIVSPDAAPIKRMVQAAKESGKLWMRHRAGRRKRCLLPIPRCWYCQLCSRRQSQNDSEHFQKMKQKENTMADKGILVVVSGFSGAGKGTLMKRLMEKYDNYALSISATTRAPRQGEEHGREYFFHTKQEFEELILQDALIEYAQYVENYYGTPKAYVEKQLNAGKDVILEIEIQGALKVKEKFPDTLLLFVTPPSAEELRRRLINRGTESMEVIESRLRRASEEAKGMPEYDYILINDEIEACVDKMHEIIQSQHDTVRNRQKFIEQITTEVAEFKKGE